MLTRPSRASAGMLAGAVVVGAGFVAWQARLMRRGRKPLMDLALFGYRPFAMGAVVAFIYGTALFGSTYLLPVFMQLGLELSASHVGALMLPAGLVLAITIIGVGRLADHQPAHRLVSIGLVLLALSFGLMYGVRMDSPLWILVGFAVLGRIGLGFILPSLNLGAMRPLEKSLIAQGSSTIGFIRMLGGASGVSLCGIVLEWRLSAHGATLIAGSSGAGRLTAFGETFLMLAGLCLVAVIAAWKLRALPPSGAAHGA